MKSEDAKKKNKKLIIIEDDGEKNQLQLYNEMQEKYQLLEQKITEMSKMLNTLMKDEKGKKKGQEDVDNNKGNNTKNKALSVIDLLNSNAFAEKHSASLLDDRDKKSLNNFVAEAFNQSHLNILFNHKYEEAFVFIILDLLSLYEKNYKFKIIQAFDQHLNTIYIYDPTDAASNTKNKWSIWTDISIVTIIYQKILIEFDVWQLEYRSRILEDDDLANKYSLQMIKIMGNTTSNEKMYSFIIKKLYKLLKMDIRDFI